MVRSILNTKLYDDDDDDDCYIVCVSLLNRKLLMICDVEVDLWAQAEEPALQQKDCSSCGVFALKLKQSKQIRDIFIHCQAQWSTEKNSCARF